METRRIQKYGTHGTLGAICAVVIIESLPGRVSNVCINLSTKVSVEGGHLVFHECDERTDDQRGSSARDGGELVTEALAGAGGHDQENVLSFDGRLAHSFLVGTERGEAKRAVLDRALQGGDPRELPVRAVLQSARAVRILWTA